MRTRCVLRTASVRIIYFINMKTSKVIKVRRNVEWQNGSAKTLTTTMTTAATTSATTTNGKSNHVSVCKVLRSEIETSVALCNFINNFSLLSLSFFLSVCYWRRREIAHAFCFPSHCHFSATSAFQVTTCALECFRFSAFSLCLALLHGVARILLLIICWHKQRNAYRTQCIFYINELRQK